MRWIAVLLLCLSAATAVALDPTVHKPLAMVQTELITLSDVQARAKRTLDSLGQVYRGDALMRRRAEVLHKTLEKMIEERLLVAEGRRLMAQNPNLEAWVAGQVERITRDQSRRDGAGIRFNKDLRIGMEDYVLMTFVERRFIEKGIHAGPAEVRAYYDNNPEEFELPRRVGYRQIVLKFEDFDDKQAALDRAEWIHRNLAPDGRDFGRWAIKYSGGPHAEQGGVWEPGEFGVDAERLRKTVLNMGQGEISPPLEGPEAVYLFFVERALPASTQTFHEAGPAIREMLLARKKDRNRRAFIAELYKRFNTRKFE